MQTSSLFKAYAQHLSSGSVEITDLCWKSVLSFQVRARNSLEQGLEQDCLLIMTWSCESDANSHNVLRSHSMLCCFQKCVCRAKLWLRMNVQTIIDAILSFCRFQQSDVSWKRFLVALGLGLTRCSSSSVASSSPCNTINDNPSLCTMLFKCISVRIIDRLHLTESFSSKNICK